MTSKRAETRYHIVLPSSDGAAVLALRAGTHSALPGWTSHDEPSWEATAEINRKVHELFGPRVATLRACRLDWSEHRRDNYYVVEALESDWEEPEGAFWLDAAQADKEHWQEPAEHEVLRAWFSDRPASKRVAWYRPGWFASASDWIERQVEAAGLTRTGEVEQLRSWERSSIMRVETSDGRLYFKAVAPQWGHEPALTRYLAARYPQLLPLVITAEPSSGRMLLGEFSGTPLPEQPDLACWCDAYAALGRVQSELVDALPELSDLGVPVRDLDAIEREIPLTLTDRRRMRAGMDGGLDEDQIARLQAAEPALRDACRRLAAGPIPLSLDHGDFWPGNIYASQERVTLFDWSDATLTHPFFSLVMAADEIGEFFPEQPDAPRQVIDAYLAAWTAYGSPAELRAIFDDAMLVAPLYLASMYRSVYLPAMEFADELDRMTPHFLRWLERRV